MDIPIEELIIQESLSVRASNVCAGSGLITLKQIINFYNVHGSFKTIRNCGSKTNDELIAICIKYKDFTFKDDLAQYVSLDEINKHPNIISGDLQLGELRHIEKLSTRAYYVCVDNSLTTLSKIKEFYALFGSFRGLSNCGSLVDDELIKICDKYPATSVPFSIDFRAYTPEYGDILSLDILQKEVLDKYLIFCWSKLHVRTKNALLQLSNTMDPAEIYKIIFHNAFDFKNIKNVGTTSAAEFEKFKQSLHVYTLSLKSLSQNALKLESLKLTLQNTFSISPDLGEMLSLSLDNNGDLRLFYLLKLLIDSDLILEPCEKELFNSLYRENDSKDDYLSEIAASQELSRERVRQIKVKLERNIQKYFQFIVQLPFINVTSYIQDQTTNFLIIDENIAKEININEDCNFNCQFIGLVFRIICNDIYAILGNDKIESSISKKYHYCYLLRNSLVNIFEFDRFLDDIYKKKRTHYKETFTVNFKSHLQYFFRSNLKENLYTILMICESLLLHEFGLTIDNAGFIKFESDKIKKSNADYCYEILNNAGQPMKLNDLLTALLNKFPNFQLDAQNLRACLNNHKEKFIFFGRSSTYGLCQWENDRDDIKGGTIRDIIEEYLTNEATPRHYTEILSYLMKYRPGTTAKSVLTNIKLDKSKRFRFFPGDFVGLSYKSYSNELNFKKVNGNHFRLTYFNQMIGWHYERVLDFFVKKYDYNSLVVNTILLNKISIGKLKFSDATKILLKVG